MKDNLSELSDSDSAASSSHLQFLRGALLRARPIAVIFVTAILAVSLFVILFPTPTPLTADAVDQSIVNAMASATPPPAYSAEVYQTILPSLAIIQIQGGDPDDEDQFGIGSGVVINDQGDILTAWHVVADAQEIVVSFADGGEVKADVAASEPENDIAVLHPRQAPGLIVPAVLRNPYGMRIGDETFAVGNPLGLAGSMSAGVISGFDRSFQVDESGQMLEGLIQFDAAVNPGNSGGPLLNRNGQVIGIVTALANPSDQNFFTGIGFAVPIGTAVSIAGGPAY
ncbi:MAG: trypsin-like peptidase domain-containing protein [Chloroflexota bacterium]|nr:MAG: trypsin-like peptidase domain-containing protein [Chloroflexota bacterium]